MSYKKFTHDVGLIGATQLSLILVGLILIPIITKTLGAYQYGIWAQITVTISLLSNYLITHSIGNVGFINSNCQVFSG
jgi:O-antigen/teichoic acid export membrane protein